MSQPNADQSTPPPPAGEIMGHPRGLWMLFGAEFWERFCYYGMRAILAVYVADAFFKHLGAGAQSQASLTYGGYTALVYATGIFGGFLADKYLGYQRSIMLGGLLMAGGCALLTVSDKNTFLIGLSALVVGTGLFKPNISSMVGKLYPPGDVRRDSGFTIFYMGINAGAFFAPIVTAAWIGHRYGLRWGFLAATIGMIFGLGVFQILKGWLGHVGKPPEGKASMLPVLKVFLGACISIAPVFFLLSRSNVLGYVLGALSAGLVGYLIVTGIQGKDKVQLQRNIAMLVLFSANVFFWSLFEQAGSSLNFFARDMVNLDAGFFKIPFGLFQSVNPVFILMFGPLFAMLWPKLDQVNLNPSIPRKFALALMQVGLGFLVVVMAIRYFQDANGKVHWIFLTLTYLLHTTGELCLSPIGLSMVTKLARPDQVGVAMGGWFLSTAGANYLAGLIASMVGGGGHGAKAAVSIAEYGSIYMNLFWTGLIFGALYLVLAPVINKLMHGVK